MGIRPAGGVTGMGGMGKTQLAVEYAYRHRAEYPGGVFWLNAAGDWRAEFAALGIYLDPSRAGEPQEMQIRAAADYLQAHPDCLLVLDNVEDPQQLRRPLTRFLLPSALPCAVLFTTRRHDLGGFRPVELPVLPRGAGAAAAAAPSQPAGGAGGRASRTRRGGEDLRKCWAGCRWRWRSPARTSAAGRRGACGRTGRSCCAAARWRWWTTAGAACARRSWARAMRRRWRRRWRSSGRDWARTPACCCARPGELPEAAAIPLARLGLLVGLKEGGGDFFGDPLADAAGELVDASLLEDLRGDLVRLHPLVREFAAQQTPAAEREGFRWECAARLIVAYDDLAVLEAQCARRGIDAVEQDLLTGLGLLGEAGAAEPIGAAAALLLRAVRQESHTLRGWDAGQEPALFREQWLKRATAAGRR